MKGFFIFFAGIILLSVLFSCNHTNTLFISLPSSHTGIHFKNTITENDSTNILDYEYVYNGSGVGVGDFNNDGLQDVYFAANMKGNELYLNKGNMHFQEITDASNTSGEGKWCTGVAVVDINNDGRMDIYVCASRSSDPEKRKNCLYINKGLNKDGIPVFKDEAAAYGLADTSYSTQAAFFDYDNDGDLDMYLLVAGKVQKGTSPNTYRPKLKDGSSINTDKLFRNDWNSSLHHPYYTDVSKEAGITIEGYGLGVNITDINQDGWKDIFVSNDYISNDLLWINNHDGTFTEKAGDYFKHTSFSAMGNEAEDINNDGLVDLVELDMAPQDNFRKKTMLSANSYQTYQNFDYYGYQYQYTRNTLQLNRGRRVLQNDSIGEPIFSEVGFMSGIAETDWSWTPLVTDFDNDGYRDIIVTNGFPKDLSDHDFIAYRNNSSSVASKQQLLEQLPEAKLHNYAFRNSANLTFDNMTAGWGLQTPSFSNGAAYADLDNDGDMDMVINNINDEAFVYQNTAGDNDKKKNQYLNIEFEGDSLNKGGLGTWVQLYYDNGKHQVYENTPYRGYLSSIQNIAHFGLGNINRIDSVVIQWPNGKKQVLPNVKTGQLLKVAEKDAHTDYTFPAEVIAKEALLTEVTDAVNIHYQHKEREFIDFNIQKLLPHKFSEYGPALAVGDIDGNGLDDMISGGASSYSAQLFLQQRDGHFIQKSLVTGKDTLTKISEDLGMLLFDADSDGDLDLYVASGGYKSQPNTAAYQDKLYVNDGKGNFALDTFALPQIYTSKSCVRAADYDKDGDLDLFVAGRVDPWNYPKPVSSYIFRNDSKNGKIKFTDVTASVAKPLINIGLVCDAVFTDFDNDGWLDIVIAGEWMPITFLKNEKGIFHNSTSTSNIGDKKGWWTSIVPGDFDNDGDIDFIAGNLGLNSFFKASSTYPVNIYAKDFDNNGSYDAIITSYLTASQQDTEKKQFPVHTRDDMIKQMVSFRSRFPNYKSFAAIPFNQMLNKEELKGALTLQANYLSNSFIKNNGNGQFEIIPLPMMAQVSCLNGMVADDFDGDGYLDVLAVGNDYGTDVSIGRYDGSNGILLKGNGKGGFVPLSIRESGFFVPGNGKALVKLRGNNGQCLMAASQNKGPLKVYAVKRNETFLPLQSSDVSALLKYRDGTIRKAECYYGASFLSQSGRFLNIDNNVVAVEITDGKGNKRSVAIKQ